MITRGLVVCGTGQRAVPRHRGRHRLLIAGLVTLAAACSSSDEPAFAGSCFAQEPRTPATTATVDCNEGRFEVVSFDSLETAEDATWPGTLELSRATFDQCLDIAEAYVGRALPELGLDIWIHHPSEEAWRDGDRDFVCAVQRLDGGPLDGTTQGDAA